MKITNIKLSIRRENLSFHKDEAEVQEGLKSPQLWENRKTSLSNKRNKRKAKRQKQTLQKNLKLYRSSKLLPNQYLLQYQKSWKCPINLKEITTRVKLDLRKKILKKQLNNKIQGETKRQQCFRDTCHLELMNIQKKLSLKR